MRPFSAIFDLSWPVKVWLHVCALQEAFSADYKLSTLTYPCFEPLYNIVEILFAYMVLLSSNHFSFPYLDQKFKESFHVSGIFVCLPGLPWSPKLGV